MMTNFFPSDAPGQHYQRFQSLANESMGKQLKDGGLKANSGTKENADGRDNRCTRVSCVIGVVSFIAIIIGICTFRGLGRITSKNTSAMNIDSLSDAKYKRTVFMDTAPSLPTGGGATLSKGVIQSFIREIHATAHQHKHIRALHGVDTAESKPSNIMRRTSDKTDEENSALESGLDTTWSFYKDMSSSKSVSSSSSDSSDDDPISTPVVDEQTPATSPTPKPTVGSVPTLMPTIAAKIDTPVPTEIPVGNVSTKKPTNFETPAPTLTPTIVPVPATKSPTKIAATPAPTKRSTDAPTEKPTTTPADTEPPSKSPTIPPTKAPVDTVPPTQSPTSAPTPKPTPKPTALQCDVPVYTKQQVAQHADDLDCWFILYDNVYDYTNYMDAHPGGSFLIASECGTDATAVYETGPGHGESLLVGSDYFIGVLGDTPC